MVEIKSRNEDESENIAKNSDIDCEQAFHTKLLYSINIPITAVHKNEKQIMKNTIRLFKTSTVVFLKIIC